MMKGLAFSHFLIPKEVPKLAIVDGGSEFNGVLIPMCDQLCIFYHVTPPDAHNAILCECFHRCLNKVQQCSRRSTMQEMGR
jgi:hypothetical protein